MADWGMKLFKQNFFDAKKIVSAIDRAEAKVLAKFGAFTRRRMKSSIQYRDKGSAPAGQPPFAHRSKGFTKQKTNKKTGAVTRQQQSPLRELIFFARDPQTHSVVIGPVAFGKRAAGLIEKGGVGVVKGKPAVFAPHPFARPAGEAEAKKLPELLRGMVK